MPSRWALLIGSASTPLAPRLPPLKGAELDAWALFDVLVDAEVGLFDRAEICVLQNPRSQEVLNALAALVSRALPDDTLLVYFSGHGLLDLRSGEFYWATLDTVEADLEATAVAASEIHRLLDTCASQVVAVVLDCCHGGALGMVAPPDRYSGYGRYVISSVPAGSASLDQETVLSRQSAFTKHLTDALRSEAGDRDGDGYVDFIDVVDYLSVAMVNSGLSAPVYRVEGKVPMLLARRRQSGDLPCALEASEGQTGFTVLARDVVHACPLPISTRAVALLGNDQRRLAIPPSKLEISVPPDISSVTACGGTISAWSSKQAMLFNERLDLLASYSAMDDFRIVDMLTCHACAWIFERTERTWSFPVAPHIEWGLRCIILGRDGIQSPIDLGRCAEWPNPIGARTIKRGFTALRAGDAAVRHIHVVIQRAHKWSRVPVVELVTIAHVGVIERLPLGMFKGPDFVAWTCHEDGEIGALTTSPNELSFVQSERVLHSVPLRQWFAQLVPHSTGVLAVFIAHNTGEWQLWRSCHDGVSGCLHNSSYKCYGYSCFGNYFSITEQNRNGTCHAVLLDLKKKNRRIIGLNNISSMDSSEANFPVIIAEDPDGFLAAQFSNSDGSSIIYAPKSLVL